MGHPKIPAAANTSTCLVIRQHILVLLVQPGTGKSNALPYGLIIASKQCSQTLTCEPAKHNIALHCPCIPLLKRSWSIFGGLNDFGPLTTLLLYTPE